MGRDREAEINPDCCAAGNQHILLSRNADGGYSDSWQLCQRLEGLTMRTEQFGEVTSSEATAMTRIFYCPFCGTKLGEDVP